MVHAITASRLTTFPGRKLAFPVWPPVPDLQKEMVLEFLLQL